QSLPAEHPLRRDDHSQDDPGGDADPRPDADERLYGTGKYIRQYDLRRQSLALIRSVLSHMKEHSLGKVSGWRIRLRQLSDSPWVWLAGLTLLAAGCVWALRAVAPWEKITPDYICYWAAGKLVASGQSPYDEALQTRLQQERGWDRAADGLGKYDF